MKLYVHYTIWNKAAHVPWLCEGIRNCIPKDAILDFTLENCTDSSEVNLRHCLTHSEYGGLKGYDVRIHTSTKNYRWPNTNDAIERFLKTDCTHFLSPQDDQQFHGRQFYTQLSYLYHAESNIGIVGMRDGVDLTGTYHSSNFSIGFPGNTQWLDSGDFFPVDYVNDGPICLSREVIQKVGLFDLDYWVHYNDQDYSFRCTEAGFQNYVMGTEVVHEKWGCKICGEIKASEVWGDKFSKHDYEVYRKKWPNRY